MTNTTLDREIEQRLADRGVRYTRGRKAVTSALARADGPLSAAELHELIRPSVPLSSLYRSLAVLEEVGVLIPHFGQAVSRYELAEWLAGHHHHLVCLECGTVDDVELPEHLEKRITALVEEIGSMTTFSPSDHSLEIEGTCGRHG